MPANTTTIVVDGSAVLVYLKPGAQLTEPEREALADFVRLLRKGRPVLGKVEVVDFSPPGESA